MWRRLIFGWFLLRNALKSAWDKHFRGDFSTTNSSGSLLSSHFLASRPLTYSSMVCKNSAKHIFFFVLVLGLFSVIEIFDSSPEFSPVFGDLGTRLSGYLKTAVLVDGKPVEGRTQWFMYWRRSWLCLFVWGDGWSTIDALFVRIVMRLSDLALSSYLVLRFFSSTMISYWRKFCLLWILYRLRRSSVWCFSQEFTCVLRRTFIFSWTDIGWKISVRYRIW